MHRYHNFITITEKYDRGEDLDAAGLPRRLGMEYHTLYTLAMFCMIVHYTFTVRSMTFMLTMLNTFASFSYLRHATRVTHHQLSH